jgi:SPX domain protein involved in polyphosphate accumulation
MTAPSQTNAQGNDTSKQPITEENFLKLIESEMAKVESFTLTKVTQLRQLISTTEALLLTVNGTSSSSNNGGNGNERAWDHAVVDGKANDIADEFLRLEKYVNLNFMGFHKILKKHDKNLPNNPCKAFYVNRLHAQAWVRGDYSDIVVRLSNIYSALRDDRVAQENTDESQAFMRSTTKYWVKTEDVSRVKYAILRHLPVFLQKSSTGESDSQFTNSVYVDNDLLELYHGRLDKTPGAIALRLRWYGPGDPSLVFVERKTHNEKWTGEVSVKERFTVRTPFDCSVVCILVCSPCLTPLDPRPPPPSTQLILVVVFQVDESEVQQVLTNTYPIAKKKQAMLDKGKSQKEADEWETLVREITQVCASKQLVPTMRTQCMRTAFQIPFDATVRVSLDTNLCMISERGYDLHDMSVWHRDPSWVLEKNEIHRFPHAVLEIKLEMSGGNMTPPQWVADLQNSGMLYECHKYSKFVHGCAVLVPDDVQSVPYWIDDVSLRQAIIDSGASRILAEEDKGVGPGANAVYSHLLPFGTTIDNRIETAVGRTHVDKAASKGLIGEKAPLMGQGVKFYDDADEEDDYDMADNEEEAGCIGWLFPFCSRNNAGVDLVTPTSIQKIEPKVFFANERTFLHWLHHGVILSAIASGILAFSQENGDTWAEWYALALLPISLFFCVYALHVFLWRADRIKTRIPGRWDDPVGPLLLGSMVVIVLFSNFCIKLYEIAKYAEGGEL